MLGRKRARSPASAASEKATAYLLKTEPHEFSITDLESKGTARWDGIRNFRARNFLSAMSVGTPVFIYHSSTKLLGVVGIGRVATKAYADPAAADPKSKYFDAKSCAATVGKEPRWVCIDVKFERRCDIVSLEQMKGTKELENMLMLRCPRLSVSPLTASEEKALLALMQ